MGRGQPILSRSNFAGSPPTDADPTSECR